MVKIRKNRMPRDWSKVTKERNFTSSVQGMKDFNPSREKPESEIIRVKAHRLEVKKEIEKLQVKAGQGYDARNPASIERHTEIEAKILRKKRLVSMLDAKIMRLDAKIRAEDRRAARLRNKMADKIQEFNKQEKKKEKVSSVVSKLTEEQKQELLTVFESSQKPDLIYPEPKKVRIETVGGRRKIRVKSKKPFDLS